tara:strand:+ start:334 stop:468 length:135 start_codon:yes stop_codon:yes gene_type:complete
MTISSSGPISLSGTVNTGGGGGGRYANVVAGAGGSGIVLVRYQI